MNRVKKSRIYDLINLDEWEVRLGIGISLLFVLFFSYIHFYEEFNVYQNALKDIVANVLGAFIGLLGFSLSGIAIIVSLFSKEETKLINEINGKGTIEKILASYSFLAKNIGIQCLILIMFYFLISSRLDMVSRTAFYILLLLEIYHVVFILLYTVALTEGCIELYKIKNIYSEIENATKTIYDTINEVKIDFIFSTLINNYNISTNEVVKKLVMFVEESEIEKKDIIIKYIKSQYEVE